MESMYGRLAEEPELLFTKLHDDDAYPNRYNRNAYGKPELYRRMQSGLKKIHDWLAFLFETGKEGTIEDGVLRSREFPGLFAAWEWMTKRENATVLAFARCMFNPAHDYLEDAFSRMFGDEGLFRKLTAGLREKGYTAHGLVRGDDELDYVKELSPAQTEIGDPRHGDPNHIGLSFEYRPDAATPQLLVDRIQKMAEMLESFDAMPDGLQQFVLNHTKRCDDCRYCVQTECAPCT